jgi:ribosomal protein S1
LKQLTPDPWSVAQDTFQVGQVHHGTVERHDKGSVFVSLAPGITGRVRPDETGLAPETDMRRAFPAGSGLDVVILEVDAAARRMRLSVKAIATAQEAAEVREYTERQDEAQKPSLGSLAEKLRGALGTREPR